MNTALDPTVTELFEVFHGPSTSPRNSSPVGPVLTNPFTNPVLLDLKHGGESARLSEFGLSRVYVESIASDDPKVEHELRRQLIGKALVESRPPPPLEESVRDAIARSGIHNLPYIQTLLQCGHFLTICPISGRPVKSDGSFVLDGHHIAYRFTGDVVFYLIVGRFHGRRAALCIPSRNLVVTLDVPERGLSISRWVAQSMRRLINHSLADPRKFRERLDSSADDLTLVIGGMPNFGHHIWQELSGIADLLSMGHLPRVRSLLVGPHTWFRLEQVFPELAGLPATKCATTEEMMVGGLGQAGTLIRPIGMQITHELRLRLRGAAAASLGPEQVRRITEAGERSRLVWINLRAHNKRWQSQIEGYAALLNALQEEFGNTGVVYDGLADSAEIRTEIDRRLHAGIARHDTIGAPIESSILWAQAVSVYVSVVGSGLVLNSWLVQKPGVAHANRAHLNQRGFWNSVSQGMIPTAFIGNESVSDDGTLYGDYDFDWRMLVPLLRQGLAVVEPKAPAFNFSHSGTCPNCEQAVEFIAKGPYFRSTLKCAGCGSTPRHRAVMSILSEYFPKWREMRIHECSPGWDMVSQRLARECATYFASQYDSAAALGVVVDAPRMPCKKFQNENLEEQSYPDSNFDLVITQDVFEHLYRPDMAIKEIARTLRPGGAALMTVPLVMKLKPSRRRATVSNGTVQYLLEPQFRGNPIGRQESLVTIDWGYDIIGYLQKHSGLSFTMIKIDNIDLGIRAELIEVLVGFKLPIPNL